jgi:hypothetical protein
LIEQLSLRTTIRALTISERGEFERYEKTILLGLKAVEFYTARVYPGPEGDPMP